VIASRKKILIVLPLIAVILIIAYFLFFDSQNFGQEVAISTAEKGTLTKTVTVSGNIVGHAQDTISLPSGPKVISILVEENQLVEKGQLLLVLDSTETDIAIEKTHLSIQQIEDDLALLTHTASNSERQLLQNHLLKAKEDFKQAEINYRISLENLQQADSLLAGNALSQMEYDRQEKNLLDSESYLTVAKLNLENITQQVLDLNHLQANQIQALTRQMEIAGLDLLALEEKKKDLSIYSNLTGILTQLPVSMNRSVSQGAVAEVIAVDQLKMIALVPQEDALLIQLNAPATVHVSGLQIPLPAKVSHIGKATVPDSQSASRTPRIEITLSLETTPDMPIASGFEADAVITVNQIDEVVVLKRESVRVDSTQQAYVYKVVEDKLKKTLVQTGIFDDFNIAILDGISPGDWIVTNPSLDLSDGDLVRPVQ